MNRTFAAAALAALTMTAVGGVALAQQAPERSPARGLRADADGDQRLSQAEFVGRRVERLTAADADRDGSVTRDEMRAVAQTRRAERADARFDRLDANDDGALSKAEFEARREHRADAGGDRGPRRHRDHRRGDRATRMAERGPVVIAEARGKAEAAFTRLDTDHDGFVTAAERQSAHAARRDQRHERRMARRAQQASPPAPASE